MVPDYRTQKAKGIWQSYINPPSRAGLAGNDPSLRVYPRDITALPDWEHMFARPCPTRPRHGFVESRPVKNAEQVLNIFAETLRADPLGELVITKRLSGKWSGVATNAGVTWGTGNDSVTGHGNAVVTIPAPGDRAEWNGFFFNPVDPYYPSDFGIEDTVYAEIVDDDGVARLVQLRDGPEQSTERNYIPEAITVHKVRTPQQVNFDLLEWERLIQAAPVGTAVYLQGGSLASHYAIHAIQRGIPVVTDREIRVGETLTPEKTSVKALKAPDYKNLVPLIRNWIADRDYILWHDVTYSDVINNFSPATWQTHVTGALITAIATVQTQHLWNNASHLMQLRAAAVPTLIRFLVSAVSGELRHMKSGFDFPTGFAPVSWNMNRTSYYMPVLQGKTTLDQMRNFLLDAAEAFHLADGDEYEEHWEVGYGGWKWAEVADVTGELIEVLLHFMKMPNAATWNELMETANRAINTAHNNGYAVEKWIDEQALSVINSAPAVGFMNDFAARVALGLPTTLEKMERA